MSKLRRRTLLGIGGGLLVGSVAAGSVRAAAGPAGGLTQVGRYESGLYDEGGAEITAYDPRQKRLFVVNAGLGVVDVLNVANPARPRKIDEIDTSRAFGSAGDTNNVDVYDGVLAVAIANEDEQLNGRVAFYDTRNRRLLNTVEVGALPDMVTFTPDGQTVLTANEGEPQSDYNRDPQGSVSVIDVSDGVEEATVTTAGFGGFDADELREAGVRIYGSDNAAQDLEPEYIAVSADSETAYVTLQENNALAVVDVSTSQVSDVVPLGYKDHSVAGNELDAIADGRIAIETQPLVGMYQPDTIGALDIDDETYLVTANEGDAREYDALFEVGILTQTDDGFILAIDDDGESRTEDVPVDESAFEDGELEALVGLEATAVRGDTDGDGAIERLHVFGGRSFAVWRVTAGEVELVYESGDALEQLQALYLPTEFNSDDDSVNDLDGESAASGPEPEGIAAGYVDGVPVVFVGLEEVGGVAMFDLSDPTAPALVDYVNNRIFDLTELGLAADADLGDALEDGDIEAGEAGDLAPEGLLFIPAEDAPQGTPLLVVGNEVSGTTTIYEIGV
jgi:hypothetical protein